MRKRDKKLPISSTCRNCGTQTQGQYCHICGQSLFEGRGLALGSLIYNLLENAFAFDGKAPRSIAAILFRPGFLSSEYRDGRITRYVHPVKLFWMVILIFVALAVAEMEYMHNVDVENHAKTEQSQTVAKTQTTQAATVKIPEDPLTQVNKHDQEGQDIEEIDDHISFETVAGAVSKYTPFVAFMLIPVFALLLRVLFRRKRYFYMYHMVFTVHFHTFLLLYFIILMALDLLWPEISYPDWLASILIILPGAYLTLALWRFYRPRWFATAVTKAVSVTILYAILIVTISVFIAIAVAWYLEAQENWIK